MAQKGESCMGGWKTKIIFLLVVYFAGFATAIYTLAPVSDKVIEAGYREDFSDSVFRSDDFAESFNVQMRKFLGVAKNVGGRTVGFVKQKMDQSRREQSYIK